MRSVLATLLAAWLAACGGKAEQGESPSHGNLTVVADEQLGDLLDREADAYDSIFTDAHVTIESATAHDAVVDLLSGRTKAIILAREFLPEERKLIDQYRLEIAEYTLFHDALAIVVNRANPIDSISTTDLASVLNRSITSWKKIGSSLQGAIHTILPPAGSSAYAMAAARVTRAPIPEATRVATSGADVLASVRHDRDAIGIVDWAVVSGDSSVRVLRIIDVDSTGAHGPPVLLHAAYIASGAGVVKDASLPRYPLTHPVVGYTTERYPALAKGFLTHCASPDGQRIGLARGLVPATQIIHLIPPE